MRFEQIGCIVENLVIISTIDYKKRRSRSNSQRGTDDEKNAGIRDFVGLTISL